MAGFLLREFIYLVVNIKFNQKWLFPEFTTRKGSLEKEERVTTHKPGFCSLSQFAWRGHAKFIPRGGVVGQTAMHDTPFSVGPGTSALAAILADPEAQE